MIGKKVKINNNQPLRLNGPKCPGRIGIVLRKNEFQHDKGGLWYIKLEPTKKKKSRVDLFFGDELTII